MTSPVDPVEGGKAVEEPVPVDRRRGWAMSDELLSAGIRSVAAPVRDRSGRIAAAVNVTVHAAETSIERLLGEYLPELLETAAAITLEWERLRMLPLDTGGVRST